jgi:hypothetical protein
LSRIVGDCIEHYRVSRFGPADLKKKEMLGPIEYSSDDKIYQVILEWVESRSSTQSHTSVAPTPVLPPAPVDVFVDH